jgi:hypothetical protein
MDAQTLMTRRILAGVIGIVVILILFFGIRACGDARRAQAFQDYVADVGDLISESNGQSDTLFTLLEDPGTDTDVDVQNTVNGLRVEAEQLVERARAIKTPKELASAQDYLLETLRFRSDGLRGVADQLPSALGDSPQDAMLAIAGQMQNFLTSDVIYSQRVIPAIQLAARNADVLERIGTLPDSKFLPDVKWLTESTVSDALGAIGGTAAASGGKASPGLHGTGLQGVTVQPSGDALDEGAVTTISESSDLAFDVEVQNQGENDESNVPVTISITGGTAPIDLSGQIESIKQGETVAVTVPVTDPLPTDTPLTADVQVEGVPGEESVDNNKAKYQFTVTP